jgi:hypothetical protein
MTYRILNSRGKRKLGRELAAGYGVDERLFDDYELIQSGGDVWVASRMCLTIELEGLNVESVGLQVLRDGAPTIHGVQLLFKTADLTELNEGQAKDFIGHKPVTKEGKVMSYRGHPLDIAVKMGQDSVKRRS